MFTNPFVKLLPGKQLREYKKLPASQRAALERRLLKEPKHAVVADVQRMLGEAAPPKELPVPQQPPKDEPPPLKEPPQRAVKAPVKPVKLPGAKPLQAQAAVCTARGCDWAVAHRPQTSDQLEGAKSAMDKLTKWWNDRRNFVQYINARRSMRMAKYADVRRGITSGDAIIDQARIPVVALLHGPPGVGKTSAAEIFMRRAGLRCEEVNASDVNTGSRLKSVLQRTVCSANMGLIVDEFDGMFDGAGAGITPFMKALESLSLLCGPVILIANDVKPAHVKALRGAAWCLVVRMYPLSAVALRSALTTTLQRHRVALPDGVQDKIIENCHGDARAMLHAAQFAAIPCALPAAAHRATGCDEPFDATAGLLQGKGCLASTSLYHESRLVTALAFYNYLPAAVAQKPRDVVAELDRLAAQADALSAANAQPWSAHTGVARRSLDILDQTFRAHPCSNVVNTFQSRLKPGQCNVRWPVSKLLRSDERWPVPTWMSYPVTLPASHTEREPWRVAAQAIPDVLQRVPLEWHATLLHPVVFKNQHGNVRC